MAAAAAAANHPFLFNKQAADRLTGLTGGVTSAVVPQLSTPVSNFTTTPPPAPVPTSGVGPRTSLFSPPSLLFPNFGPYGLYNGLRGLSAFQNNAIATTSPPPSPTSREGGGGASPPRISPRSAISVGSPTSASS